MTVEDSVGNTFRANQKGLVILFKPLSLLEGDPGIEPGTFGLGAQPLKTAIECLRTILNHIVRGILGLNVGQKDKLFLRSGAGDGLRTRDPQLGRLML
jgi:hypothetical protein